MKYIGFLISSIFIYLLFKDFNSNKNISISEFSSKVNILYFFIGILFNLLAYIAHTLRWKTFFVSDKIKNITFKTFFKTILCGHFFNTILPSKAGEFIRPYYFSKMTGVKYFTALSTCLVERLFDGFTIILMAVISITLIFSSKFGFYNESLMSTSAIYLTLILSPILLIKYKKLILKITNHLPSKIKNIADNLICESIEGFKQILTLDKFSKVLSSTLLYWGFSSIGMYFLLICCPLPPQITTPIVSILIISVMGLVLFLPSAPANIGIYSYTLMIIFNQLIANSGLDLDVINENYFTISSIVIHLGAIIPDLFFGGIAYLSMPSNLRGKLSHQNL